MRLDVNKLSSAIRLSLSLGAVAAAGTLTAQAQTTDQKSQSLETIVVTGSNIRRVDIETANPVVTIDAAAIQNTGKLTLGDIVQSLPANMNGTNPQVNNGGGSGSATVSLRGLGATVRGDRAGPETLVNCGADSRSVPRGLSSRRPPLLQPSQST